MCTWENPCGELALVCSFSELYQALSIGVYSDACRIRPMAIARGSGIRPHPEYGGPVLKGWRSTRDHECMHGNQRGNRFLGGFTRLRCQGRSMGSLSRPSLCFSATQKMLQEYSRWMDDLNRFGANSRIERVTGSVRIGWVPAYRVY